MGRWPPGRRRSLREDGTVSHRRQSQIGEVETPFFHPHGSPALRPSGWATRSIFAEHYIHHAHHDLHFPFFYFVAPRACHAGLASQDFYPSPVQKGRFTAKRVHVCNSPPSLRVDYSSDLEGGMKTFCGSLETAATLPPQFENAAHESHSSSHRGRGRVRDINEGLRVQIWSSCQEGHLDKALSLLSSLKTALPTSMYVSLLKLCCKTKALKQAKQVHAHLIQRNVPTTGFLGDYIVMSLAKCGAVEDAYNLSANLPHRTVFSWTAIISAKVDAGCVQEALEMYLLMLKEGIEPNTHTYVSLFKGCGITRNLSKGNELHAFAERGGVLSDPFVRSAIVSFYSKCGSLIGAEGVFGSLLQTNIVSWNAMLAAYVEHEAGVKGLKLYRQLQEEGVRPNELTYVLILQVCCIFAEKGETLSFEGESASSFSLHIGRAIHSVCRRSDVSLFVSNALVSMYGKCGAILEAECVFGGLSDRNIVTWNSMLAAYLQEGECEKVLLLYKQMHQAGIVPSERTLVSVIQACGGLAQKEESLIVEGQTIKVSALTIGKALHMDAHRKNIVCNTFVGTSLLSMYGKCGAILEAETIFVALSYRDKVAWNAMLSMYIEHGCGLKALKLYRQMHEEGLIADEVGVVLALQACGILLDKQRTSVEEVKSLRVWALEIGKCLHADACKKDFGLDVYLGSTLITMYAKLGLMSHAENVFLKLHHRDVVLWSTMISAYVEQGQGEMALKLCQQMLREGVGMDAHALVFALQACSSLAEKDNAVAMKEVSTKSRILEIGRVLHDEARNKGFIPHPHVGIALVSMYGKCGVLDEVKDFFDSFSQGSTVLLNAMFSAYLEQGHHQEVLWLYMQMQKQRLILDDVTLICVLQACRLVGSWQACCQLHFVGASAGWDQVLPVAASIIHAYGSCARMQDVQTLFEGLARPDLVLWNACCDGFTGVGDFSSSFHVMESFELAGAKPDEVTFISALSVCSHTGYVHEGLEYFDCMTSYHGIMASLKHFGNLLDLLGRAGNFTRIEDMLKRMLIGVSFPMWLSLLGSCSVHGNIGLARQAFEQAVKLQPMDSTAYAVMSNIYIDAGLHGAAAEILSLKQHYGALETLLGDF